jgi:TnpA family transposase
MRFWRLGRDADYGVLNAIAAHQLRPEVISRNWDDLLRVAGSLQMHTVQVTELMRALQGGGRMSTLAQAIGELGRIGKTLHLLVTWNVEGAVDEQSVAA